MMVSQVTKVHNSFFIFVPSINGTTDPSWRRRNLNLDLVQTSLILAVIYGGVSMLFLITTVVLPLGRFLVKTTDHPILRTIEDIPQVGVLVE